METSILSLGMQEPGRSASRSLYFRRIWKLRSWHLDSEQCRGKGTRALLLVFEGTLRLGVCGLTWGSGIWRFVLGEVSDSPAFLFLSPFTASPTLTGSVPESKAPGAASPVLAGLSPRKTSSPIQGPQNNRCLFSCSFHSSEGRGKCPAPRQRGQGLG